MPASFFQSTQFQCDKLYSSVYDESKNIIDPKDVCGPDFSGETFYVFIKKKKVVGGVLIEERQGSLRQVGRPWNPWEGKNDP
ncbi:MAG: hypothetical protein FJ115_00180 [Deltaproteobacteria bacterium]|nr:hypothetical protein [Deltaproteobacteria bacterium]MBM4321946.1 hypothetical protein [Deltaproteobacteria bacterium]